MVAAKRFGNAAFIAFALALLFESQARADAPAAVVEFEIPALHHAPIVTAQMAEPLTIGASIDRADLVRRARLVFRSARAQGEVDFERSSDRELRYVAMIPANAVRPGLAYSIELETTKGATLPVFATRTAPHAVTVLDTPEDSREAAQLARLNGRRSVIQSSGEYATFGTSSSGVRDGFFRMEGSYTYRLLSTVAEFGLRAGVVRGSSGLATTSDPSLAEVGLNYAAPRIRLRAADGLHVEGELLTSVTEVGFAVGGGGAILFGDVYGSNFVVGVEGIQVFGVRAYTRLDLVANARLTVAPLVEVTTMPHASVAGLRLLGEAAIDLGLGLRLDLRAGYQARHFNDGGPTVGGGFAYAF